MLVLGKVLDYIEGRVSLADFQTWFTLNTWDYRGNEVTLVNAVELVLAEYTSGHRTEQEARREFRKLTRTIIVRNPGDAWHSETGSRTVRP